MSRGGASSSRAVVASLAACGLVVSMMFTLVMPLLPRFPALLQASVGNASWMATSTMLAGAVATPIVGRLADMYGKRRMLLASLAALVTGSVICALAPGLAPMLAGRVLQGAASGVIPLGISILRDRLPAAQVPMAIGVISSTVGMGAGAGLLAGGLVVDHLPWRTVFWLSAAVGAVSATVAYAVLPSAEPAGRGRVDWIGSAGLSVVLLGVLIPITKGAEWGWGSWFTLLALTLAVLVAPLWSAYQLRTRHPIVDLRGAAAPPVLLCHVAAGFIGFAGVANFLATTVMVQLPTSTGYGFGASLTTVGFCLLPGTMVFLVLSPVSARLVHARDAAFPLVLGSLVMGAGYVLRLNATDSLWHIAITSLITASGGALTFAALPGLLMEHVPRRDTAAANAINALFRAIGSALASATLAGLQTGFSAGGDGHPAGTAFTVFFVTAAGAALACALLASVVRRFPPRPNL
ncbi:MFS transporter [Acrocarpospora catenulata]|uniref:MFS transporter n=1 Tax=Acrocarpospora catenulata TaxID=2836182 RepID=UPI001BD99E63|nr:MFS transporter [Acrocarpospora catenulata]